MTKLAFTTTLPLAMLLLYGSPSRLEASGDTPITIKDGSIVIMAGGLDAGKTWNVSPGELRHLIATGVLTKLKVTEAGADRCSGNATCAVDATKKWTIEVNYGASSVTISSTASNKGVRVKFSRHIRFPLWHKTANPDEREFGTHGDGGVITGIAVNNGPNICAGKDGCEVDVIYTTP
jgi:hypothetical protein